MITSTEWNNWLEYMIFFAAGGFQKLIASSSGPNLPTPKHGGSSSFYLDLVNISNAPFVLGFQV